MTDYVLEFYMSEVGVRQGEVLCPSLFKIFINDLPSIIDDKTDSITLDGEKIPCLLLYADDLVLFSDTKNGLQQKLDILNNYCTEWCIEVNVKKTKVIIFNKTGGLMNDRFNIRTDTIECVKQYKYLPCKPYN